MQILVLILGIVLLPKVCALKCYECIPGPSGSCNERTKECPPNTRCASHTMTSYTGSYKLADSKMKTCAAAEECTGGSVNFGGARIVITSKCCTSDLCNSQDAPDGSISSPNGKKCFLCDEIDCTRTLTCNGNEEYCISTSVNVAGQNITAKGCASKLICSNMQPAPMKEFISGEIRCCQGDLCNSATSTTASLLLFVTLLTSLVLFS